MRHIFTIIALSLALSGWAQTNIETKLVMTDTVDYPFTSEWQYLTTDIYLFNANRFDKLINEMNFHSVGRKRKAKMNSQEKLEYLFVSANLKNISYFGGSDLIYPLYNFQINRDKSKQYHTYVSDDIDHIRIIDNLPLYSAGDNIDAEIKVQAISNNNSDMLMNMVGKQLQNLAKVQSPTDAVLSLVGEFGSFIESNTKKKEYRFSSTISLYKQQNFDTRLHSVKVFVMNTEKSEMTLPNTQNLSQYLDTAYNVALNRKSLASLMEYDDYPILVVLNYRSMYQMQQISGDEVTQDAIDERRARLLIDHKNGLISNETYRQERDFLRFLTAFVELKNSIELYKLNQNSGNLNATKKSLPVVISRYNNLLAIHDEMEQKYTENPMYSAVFVGEYDEIISFADLYLDGDPNLKSSKELVSTLRLLKGDGINELDSSQMERTLELLNVGNLLGEEFYGKTAEGDKAKEYMAALEKTYYQKYFRNKVIELQESGFSYSANENSKWLKKKASLSNCNYCREQVLASVEDYQKRSMDERLKLALRQKDSITGFWSDSLLLYIQNARCIAQNLDRVEQSGNVPVTFDVMHYHQERFKLHLQGLIEKLKVRFEDPELETINQFNDALIREAGLTKQQLDFFRKNKACYLSCECFEHQVEEPNLHSTDSLVKAISQQLEFFRKVDVAIDLEIMPNDSIANEKYVMIKESRQLFYSINDSIISIPASLQEEQFIRTKDYLETTMQQISHYFNEFCVQFPEDCVE